MAARAPLGGVSVLVVEDDYFQADDVRSALERAGAQVVGPYGEAATALAALRDRAVDCAVVDVNLGAGPSLEVGGVVKGLGIPFLFMTGYDREMLGAEFGHVMRLQKPIDPAELVKAVATLFPEGR